MKFGTFVVMFVTMIMFLEFVGVPTGASVILSSFGIDINPTTAELLTADIESSNFFSWIFGSGAGVLVLIVGGGAIIVGLFAKSYDTSLVILPAIVSIGTLLSSTGWIIIKYMQSFGQIWATTLVGIVFIGLLIAFIMSCVDYFAGR